MPALAAWPAALRDLLAEYASSASVVVVYSRDDWTEAVTLVLTPDMFDADSGRTPAATGRHVTDGVADGVKDGERRRVPDGVKDGEQWRARHEVRLPGYVRPAAEAAFYGFAFYADADSDYLFTTDRGVLYDLKANQMAEAAPCRGGISPSPYNSAVAFPDYCTGARRVNAHRNTTPLLPTRASVPPALVTPAGTCVHHWFWTRCLRTGKGGRPDGLPEGGERSNGLPEGVETAAAPGPAAYLHALCLPIDGRSAHAFLMAWNGATGEWLRLSGHSNLGYSVTGPSSVAVLQDGRRAVVVGGTLGRHGLWRGGANSGGGRTRYSGAADHDTHSA